MTDWSPERVEELAGRVAASPHVARLSPGRFGTVAFYLPGRKVVGLRLVDDDRLEVHVVMQWGSTVHELEGDVREIVGEVAGEADAMDLVIDDIDVPDVATKEPRGARPVTR